MLQTPPATQPVRATLRPLNLALHELEVVLTLPAEAVAEGGVLTLPVWTPGSYLVRDYGRFLDRLTVMDAGGRPVPLEKVHTHGWRLPARREPLTVSYRLYCNDLTVRTNHLDARHAHLVGAASFLCLEGQGGRPWEVSFEGWPSGWEVATALPEREGAFQARNHDELVDSPFELGAFRMHAFETGGCQFRMAITGDHSGDEARILSGTRAVVEACGRIFGGFPFQRYLFLLTFSPKARGGLEHRDCTSLLADPFQLDRPQGYWDLFLLIAHEFFHVWNVKRLRAPELGPFDYQRENPTRLLWFHEGFTSFMQYAIALQAGVVPWAWVARQLAASWGDNVQRAGRREQSLEESSFDAWIRHYKPTEFSPNSTVSYYDKGAMAAWIMDAQIRLASGGAQGLEALFRLLWDRFGDGTVTDGDLRAAYRELTGRDDAAFWSDWLQGRRDLDARDIEAAYGLRFQALAPWEILPEEEAQDPGCLRRARVHAGLTLQGDSPVIQNVLPGGPADRAGLSYGMEILAVGGLRTPTAQEVLRRLGDRGPGESLEVLACHLGRVAVHAVTLEENPQRTWRILLDPGASKARILALSGWLGRAMGGESGSLS